MYSQVKNIDIILSALLTFGAFFVLLVTIVTFIYFSRKKILAQELLNKDLEIQKQQEVINATIIAQEQERSRIARDLHDDIGAKLSAITMNARLLEIEDLDPKERKEIVKDTIKACTLLIENTRRISHNLAPPILDKVGLHITLEETCKELSLLASSVEIMYENNFKQQIFENLTTEQQMHLYRIVQELINNSIRHGNATKIKLFFSKSDEVRSMDYVDNGSGISKQQLESSKGIGIRNILSRANIIGAKPKFDTQFSSGFRFLLFFE